MNAKHSAILLCENLYNFECLLFLLHSRRLLSGTVFVLNFVPLGQKPCFYLGVRSMKIFTPYRKTGKDENENRQLNIFNFHDCVLCAADCMYSR